jgi:hypothetical protein
MGYFLTAPAHRRRTLTAKNRVWDFFALSSKTHPANRRQPAQPRRKIHPVPTKTVSGIPYWPARDPIGEKGGKNLYGYARNSPLSGSDYLGLEPDPRCVTCEGGKTEALKSPEWETMKKQMDDHKPPCPTPPITCKCKDPNDTSSWGATYNYSTKAISVYCNPQGGIGWFTGLIIHELSHARDHCYGSDPTVQDVNQACRARACTELRGYYTGTCRNYDPLKRRDCAISGALDSMAADRRCGDGTSYVYAMEKDETCLPKR